MTVGQLKEHLEQFDDDTPIRLALQPNYPMLGSIQNVANWQKDKPVCLIACSDNEDYDCPRNAWDDDYIEEDNE